MLAWLASLAILLLNWSGGLQLYRLGGWHAALRDRPRAGHALGDFLQLMATTVVACGTLYILGCHDKCVSYPAFMPLFLCMAAGLNGAFYTGDIFTLVRLSGTDDHVVGGAGRHFR